MLLSCPSKTFLLGEYLALKGEPCLLAGTEPRFDLRLRRGERTSPFHPDSPAGKLWARHFEETRDWSLEFTNPLKIGGLGASSAEFLLLWTALEMQKTLSWDAQLEPDVFAMLRTYSELCGETGVKPSGADVVAQLRGQVTLFEKNRGNIEMRGWGFDDLGFALFSTGAKVPTHEHLRSLGDWDETVLKSAVDEGIRSWQNREADGFVESVRRTRSALKALGFEAPGTTSLLENILENPRVLAAKGCGALGADVILVVFRRKDRAGVTDTIGAKLKYVASNEQLSEGVAVVPMTPGREVHA